MRIRKKHVSKKRLVLAMDSQQLQMAQQCARMYFNAHVLHLRYAAPVRALQLGGLIHEAIHRVNRAKLSRRRFTEMQLLEIGFRTLARKGRDLLTPDDLSFHTSKFLQFHAFRKKFERNFITLGTEVGFSKVIYEDSDVVFVYQGRIDEVMRVEPAGFTTWVDYKSESREYNLYSNRNQTIGYSWALGSNIGYYCYYGLQKEKDDPFRYKTVFHHPKLIEQWKQDTIRTFRKVLSLIPFGQSVFETNRAMCDASMFGHCQFLRLCDNEWAGPEIINGIKRTFYKIEKWNPWE